MYGPCTSTKKPLKKNETEKSKLTGGSLHLQPGVAWFSHRLAELSGLVGGSSKGGITGWLWCRCGREMRRDDDDFCLKVLKNLKGSDEVEKTLLLELASHLMWLSCPLFCFPDTKSGSIFHCAYVAGFRSNPTFTMSSRTLTAPTLRRKKRMGFVLSWKDGTFCLQNFATTCPTIVILYHCHTVCIHL